MRNYTTKCLVLFSTLFGAAAGVFAQAPDALLKDINPGSGSGMSYSNYDARLNGKVYFIADKDGYQDLLWATDGTVAGTQLAVSASTVSYVGEMVANGSRVVFEGLSGSKEGLFITNAAGTGASPLRLFDDQEIFQLYRRQQDDKVLFGTEPFAGGSSQFWVTNGTIAGTVKLGDFTVADGYMFYSPWMDKTIMVEQSTNFDQAPPVITDGTPAGTILLKDALTNVANFYSIDGAVGTGDLLFVTGKVDIGGFLYNKAFAVDSTSSQEFSLFGDIRRAFKSGDFYYLATTDELLRYDKSTNTLTTLNSNYDYFSEPVLQDEKLYFTAKDKQVWETDGTVAGTKKRSTAGIGNFNYDPRIWVHGDSLFYFSDAAGKAIRLVDLNTSTDTLFATVFQSSGLVLIPRLWKFGNTFVYPKSTAANGYEIWASPMPLLTGVFNPTANREPLLLTPNPTSGICRLPAQLQDTEAVIRIFDENGRLVATRNLDGNTLLDLSTQATGIYSVVVETKNGKIYSGSVVRK
jgi:ELWxxDGT repeat protein